jgi:glycyl-tRNA synthetase beta chain
VIRAIHAFRQTPAAEQVIAANKRVANLLRKVDAGTLPDFNSRIATEPAEQDLFNAISNLDVNTSQTDSEKLETLAALQEPVDRFFDDVLVMDDDPAVQHNRLSLLSLLRGKFMLVADFSLLQ